MIAWKLDKGTLELTTKDRGIFYSHYKYNIGGNNFTLNDIEHGVLR